MNGLQANRFGSFDMLARILNKNSPFWVEILLLDDRLEDTRVGFAIAHLIGKVDGFKQAIDATKLSVKGFIKDAIARDPMNFIDIRQQK